MVLFEDFEDSSGFTIGGGGAAYWGIAPLSGNSYSYFVQGGSQSGNIFYGSFAKESGVPASSMTIDLPDLTPDSNWYTDLQLTVSLAATEGNRWEITHRDSLIISGTTGVIDSFLPLGYSSPLTSQVYSTDLRWEFQDFQYSIDSSLTSLTFAFASTAGVEVVGIDSVSITGTLVPVPSAVILGSIGITFTGWLLKRRKML
jgi:hypothetical protein